MINNQKSTTLSDRILPLIQKKGWLNFFLGAGVTFLTLGATTMFVNQRLMPSSFLFGIIGGLTIGCTFQEERKVDRQLKRILVELDAELTNNLVEQSEKSHPYK